MPNTFKIDHTVAFLDKLLFIDNVASRSGTCELQRDWDDSLDADASKIFTSCARENLSESSVICTDGISRNGACELKTVLPFLMYEYSV